MRANSWNFIGSIILLFLVVLPVYAQWSDDPAVNLAIADRSGEQVQPKVLSTPDGGCYISWFDNSSGGYDVYLQRLDASGNEMWVHNGLLIADRSFSSTENYGLGLDTAGNALLAFRDDRFGATVITAAMVSPDGTMPWGANGVQLTSGEAVYSPGITGTSDGCAVVGWTHSNSVKLQKLDVTGSSLWGSGVVFTDTSSASFGIADLHGSDAGSVIVSWVRWGPMYWDPKHLWAQKVSATGATMWNTPGPHVIVFDGDSLQFGNYPSFVTDGSGGAAFGWYGVSPLQCYAQHILADGSEAFPHNGVPASTNVAQIRVSPDVSFNPATGETFLFYVEENLSQSQFGLHGQKFAPDGTRQWTDHGKTLTPLSDDSLLSVRNLQYDDGAMAFAILSPSYASDLVLATRVDGNGDFSWPEELVTACTLPSGKSRLNAALSTSGYAVLAWSDDRSGSYQHDIYGQNVNPDGTLGVQLADTFDVGIVCLTPALTLPDYGLFKAGVMNTSGETIDLYGHLDVVLCDGTYLADVLDYSLSVGAGLTKIIPWRYYIPAHPLYTCDCDLEGTIFVQDTQTLWEETASCVVTTSCPE